MNDSQHTLDALREATGYDPGDDGTSGTSVDALIDYKDALEEIVAGLEVERDNLADRLRRAKGAIAFALGRRTKARKRCRIYSDPGAVVRELTQVMQREETR
jgi:hypothetical protein